MALVTTLPEPYRPLMGAATVKTSRCAVCGRPGPLNEHRLVGTSLGRLAVDGGFAESPTVTLCGAGNALFVADPAGGRFMACNGKAHHGYLHFRAAGEARWSTSSWRSRRPTPRRSRLHPRRRCARSS